MTKKKGDFVQVGPSFIPETLTGWGCGFAMVLTTLALVFAIGGIWTVAGWKGRTIAVVAMFLACLAVMMKIMKKMSK